VKTQMKAANSVLCMRLLVSLGLLICIASCRKPEPRLFTVGSKSTAEQVFLAEVAAQHLEHRLGIKVARKFNWGETVSVHTGLVGSEIDAYPEYGCTAISVILRVDSVTDRDVILERVRDEYRNRYRAIWLDPLGFDSRFRVGVLKIDQAKFKLVKLSDLRRRGEGWRPGMSRDIRSRTDGFALLDANYDFNLRTAPAALDPTMFARALSENKIDLLLAESTDPLWARDDLVQLEDDARAFPPCEASFVLRTDADQAYPGVLRALGELSGKFTLAEVQEANRRVSEGRAGVESVADRFLRNVGLLK